MPLVARAASKRLTRYSTHSGQHWNSLNDCEADEYANGRADQSRMKPLQVERVEQCADQDNAEQRKNNQQKADLKVVSNNHFVPPL